MKVSVGVAAAAIVVAVALVGWFGWQMLAPKQAARPANLEELRRKHDPGLQVGRQAGSSSPAPAGAPVPRSGRPPGMPGGAMMRPGMMGRPGYPGGMMGRPGYPGGMMGAPGQTR